MKKQQQGGTILGFILGLVVGLGAAFAVAVYVTKVPVPFLNKGAVRGTEKDAAENEKNKDWDPNAPLYGKNPARPAPADPGADTAPAVVSTPAPAAVPAPTTDTASKSSATEAKDTKAAAKPESRPEAKVDPQPDAKPSASTDPLGDLANSRANTTASSTSAGNDPFTYFLQTGAFGTSTDAEAQRAKLAMMGWEARVSEREQNGRTVFRVRVGPFGKRGEAETLKEKLDSSGLDSALVRVQR